MYEVFFIVYDCCNLTLSKYLLIKYKTIRILNKQIGDFLNPPPVYCDIISLEIIL